MRNEEWSDKYLKTESKG